MKNILLSDSEVLYFASKVNMLIPVLGGLLKIYSDPTSVSRPTPLKPIRVAIAKKIGQVPVRVYTRGYRGQLNITPFNIVKQLPRDVFAQDIDAFSVEVANQQDLNNYRGYVDGVCVLYKVSNKPKALINQKPILDVRDKCNQKREKNSDDFHV